MLSSCRAAGSDTALPQLPFPDSQEAASLLFTLLAAVDGAFDRAPIPLRSGDGRSLLLLYRDAACRWRDIAGQWGEAMAAISQVWPLTLCGVTSTREAGKVTVRREDGKLVTRLYSTSGRPFDGLDGLCLGLEAPIPGDTGHLLGLCSAFAGSGWDAAVDRVHEDFLRRWGLLRRGGGSLFCYFSAGQEPEELVRSLSAARKEQLWSAYLRDGVQPLEFQWLWDSYLQGQAWHLLEWELTLEAVLEAMGLTVSTSGGLFSVSDAAGRARRFDFEQGGPAERMLLKLIFPAEYR